MNQAIESEAFRSVDREKAADALGIWIFLVSEAMLFGAILLVYLTMRARYGDVFAEASKHLSLSLGTANTAVLLTSSLTMALAHHFSVEGRFRATAAALAATALLGFAFLAVKGVEYAKEFSENIAPVLGAPFHWTGSDPQHAELFFKFYFAMTSLHALHLLSGLLVIAGVLALWPATGAAGRQRRVHAIGLYWHFVDVVWVFLFPILYLIDR